MGRFMIVRDSRENPKYGFNFPENNECRGTIIQKVEHGDYSILGYEHLIFIERKQSPFEFAKNMTEKRFHNLLLASREYKYKYIICEFTKEELQQFPYKSPKAYATDESGIPLWRKIRVKGSALYKAICTIEEKYGITFLFFDGPQKAEQYCYELLKEIYDKEQK